MALTSSAMIARPEQVRSADKKGTLQAGQNTAIIHGKAHIQSKMKLRRME
jgi:hypothetical protein